MAARSPANKARKGKVAATKKTSAAKPAGTKAKTGGTAKRAAATPAKRTGGSTRRASRPSKPAAKAPTKTPAKGATKAVTKTSSKSATKPAATKPAPAKPAPKTTASKAPAKPPKAPAKPAAKQPARKAPLTNGVLAPSAPAPQLDGAIPKPKFNKEGIGYTKDFDLPFVKAQFELLQRERIHLTGQAKRLEAEAHQLVEEAEMGDVQFDDEGGEGDTMVVERERDLALSAQARDAVAEIDAALARISAGTYGYSIISGRPIPKERLEAIPWSSVLVEEKVGGIGRR
jgi:RNA polymerase-binding transcription factor DksA